MADIAPSRLWTMRIAFLALSMTVIFFHILPLETGPRRFAAPDVLTALVLAWATRRPDIATPVLVAGVMLLADLIFQRPPGLWALLVLLASEALRPKDRAGAPANFTLEWLRFAVYVIAMTVAYRLVLSILLVSPGPLILSISQMVGTIVIYPVVVMVSWGLFGIRRPTAADMDSIGYKP